MKVITLIIAFLLLAPKLVQADTSYLVKGESQAKAVCKAVLADDVQRLDRTLKSYQKQSNIVAFYARKSDTLWAEDFECNDMSLAEFSVKVEAINVARYLRETGEGEPRIYVEDLAEQPSSQPEESFF